MTNIAFLLYLPLHSHLESKVLPPVCMKYTAQGESGVANIAGMLYLSRDSHQELYIFDLPTQNTIIMHIDPHHLYFSICNIDIVCNTSVHSVGTGDL